MLSKGFRNRQDARARPKQGEIRLRVRQRGEVVVEPSKPCPRRGAVALRHCGERCVELRAKRKQ